ncbi:MAG: polysaccharide deacetylase family protein [Oscillospiraceae bacterium]|nr:polysaccharide deacetylase family protein [Oscillospiraceae bacterium]
MKTKKYLFYNLFLVIFSILFSTSVNSIDDIGNKNNIPEISAHNSEISGNRKSNEKKYVALTFDDGPHPEYTPQVLDILTEKKAVATFFVLGYRVEQHPELLQRMKSLKCEIGNHTYDHADLHKTSKSQIVSEINKCNEAIYAATGEYPKLYRPPFGNMWKENESLIPLKKILWSVDSADWRTENPDRVVKNVISTVKENSTILMHDFYPQTIKALPEIIDRLRAEGYEFVTVSELAELSQLAKLPDFMD